VAVRKDSGKNRKLAPPVAAAEPVNSATPTVKPAKLTPMNVANSSVASRPTAPVFGWRPISSARPRISAVCSVRMSAPASIGPSTSAARLTGVSISLSK
jgi:hypothetical protein